MDIVKRLRMFAKFDPDQAEAADEIERLREALRYYAKNHYPNVDDGPWGPGSNDFGNVARAALGEDK